MPLRRIFEARRIFIAMCEDGGFDPKIAEKDMDEFISNKGTVFMEQLKNRPPDDIVRDMLMERIKREMFENVSIDVVEDE